MDLMISIIFQKSKKFSIFSTYKTAKKFDFVLKYPRDISKSVFDNHQKYWLNTNSQLCGSKIATKASSLEKTVN